MNLFAVGAVCCAAPAAVMFAFVAARRAKYKNWRRVAARVAAVNTQERRVSDDAVETPRQDVTVSFSFGGLRCEKPLPPVYENNAPAVGSVVEILYDPKSGRAVRADGFFEKLPSWFLVVFICADALAFLIFWCVCSSLGIGGGVPKFPAFYKPLLGLPFLAAGFALAARWSNLRRRVKSGKLRPIPATFAGYRLRRDSEDGDSEFALFEYEEGGVKKYYESHTAGRVRLKRGDAAELFRDAETGEVTESRAPVMPLIVAAVCFSSGVVVTALTTLL